MVEFKVIKKNGKYYVNDSENFFGDMMIYAKGSDKPYIKRMGEKIYLTDEMKAELKAIA